MLAGSTDQDEGRSNFTDPDTLSRTAFSRRAMYLSTAEGNTIVSSTNPTVTGGATTNGRYRSPSEGSTHLYCNGRCTVNGCCATDSLNSEVNAASFCGLPISC